MARRSHGWSLLAVMLLSATASAQPPDSYKAIIRYQIAADREGRILQFRELNDYLKSIGFVASKKDDAHLDAFDPAADRLEGTIPASKAGLILADVRVKSIYVEPANAPKEKPAVAQISAVLAGGLPVEQQRQLHEQVVARLAKLGFIENTAYDHFGFTRVRGRIAGNVMPTLVKDLRQLPAGWFVPDNSISDLPLPIRGTNPIRIVEWLPTAPDTFVNLPASVAKGKFSADLVPLLGNPESAEKEIRVEMLFDGPPTFSHREIADRIGLVCPSGSLEGISGQSAVVRVSKAKDVPGLANLPEVKFLRGVRAVSETAVTGSGGSASAIQGLKALHDKGLKGKNVRVAVIATEFPKRETITGQVAFVDLTGELSRTLEPAPADAKSPGTGTATALAVRAASPDAELILVRVDPFAFHQLITVAAAATGIADSDALQIRLKEMTLDSNSLATRRQLVMDEYAVAMRNISDDEKPTQRREAAKKAYDALKADEAVFQARMARFQAIRNGLTALGSTPVIVNTVVSETGQPHDGLSALNAILGEQFTPKPVRSAIKASTQKPLPIWVQAAGMQSGSIWAGPFLDADGNGVMEFSPTAVKDQWTSELNFLKPLKANASIRIAVQWREPINLDAGIDDSQFPLTLKLLRQIDPSGKTANADEMIEIAHSGGTPIRIHRTQTAAVFEQTLDVTVPIDGTYALRLEGKTVESNRPGRMPSMQISPRVVLTPNNAETAKTGPIQFAKPLAKAVGVGIPGESTNVITVGMANGQIGAGPGISMLPKPDVLAPASLGNTTGPAIAAGHTAGTLACLAGAGFRPRNLPQTLGIAPGSELKLTDTFLQYVSPR